jgi:hypothetical protein
MVFMESVALQIDKFHLRKATYLGIYIVSSFDPSRQLFKYLHGLLIYDVGS